MSRSPKNPFLSHPAVPQPKLCANGKLAKRACAAPASRRVSEKKCIQRNEQNCDIRDLLQQFWVVRPNILQSRHSGNAVSQVMSSLFQKMLSIVPVFSGKSEVRFREKARLHCDHSIPEASSRL